MRNETEDLQKLANAFFAELFINDCGTIGIDCQRPFGNRDVDGDILKIIGWEPEGDDEDDRYSSEQRQYTRSLYREKLILYLREQWSIKS